MIAKGLKDMINITSQVRIKVSSWLIETIHYKYRKSIVPINVGIEKKRSTNQWSPNIDRKFIFYTQISH